MASTYSTNLAIELIGTGDQAGSWGNTTNTNLGTLIEQAISGYVTQAVSTGTDTTITIPNGATGVARNMYIELTGTGGTNTNLIVPANKKLYFIFNNSTGAVTVKVSGQTGVSVPTGKKMVLVSNGTDIVNGLNYIADFGTNSFTVTNLTATSATITNLIATSASITTLTNNPTFGAGTANGVLYLNGSKVATSGSALTFDGTNLGLGAASRPSRLTLEGTNGAVGSQIQLVGTGVLSGYIGPSADGLNFGTDGGGLIFRTGVTGNGSVTTGSEGMRLTSTTFYTASGINVGIGTSSPGAKLAIAQSSNAITQGLLLINAAGTQNGGWYHGGSALIGREGGFDTIALAAGNVGIGTSSPTNYGATYKTLAVNGSSTGIVDVMQNGTVYGQLSTEANVYKVEAVGASTVLRLVTNSATRATLDTSGNLGLGVTPSGWASTSKAFTVKSTGSAIEGSLANSGATNAISFVSNGYYNSGWKYVYSGGSFTAGRYDIEGNEHRWHTAASGTAGNAISFTQAMTLDASGRLLVGRTTNFAGEALQIDANGVGATTYSALIGNSSTSTSVYNVLRFNQGASGSATGYIGTGGSAVGNNAFANNFVVGTQTSNALVFATVDTERARIAADGQFSVSTSLAGSNLLSFTNSSTTGYGISMSVNNDSSGTYRYFEGFSQSASAQRIAIYTNGDVKNTNGVFAAFSDVKLKKDIVDAGSQWDDIKALRVRKYKLKNDTSDVVQIGLIAQEVEQVSPGLVNESQDETRDEDGKIVLTGEVTKGVKYSILYMKAVKALQEAMARIESLEAKVAALESA